MHEKNSVLDILKVVYTETNAGLKYAEAKNAALVGFNIALLGVSSNLENINSECGKTALQIFIALLVISMIIALLSFWPYTGQMPDLNLESKKKAENENENLLFYGHLTGKRPYDYIKQLHSRYLDKTESQNETTNIEADYAREIIYNGRLAMRKYCLFRAAFIIDFIGIVLFFIINILQLLAL